MGFPAETQWRRDKRRENQRVVPRCEGVLLYHSSVPQCVLCAYLCAFASLRGIECSNCASPLLTFYRARSTLLLMANRAEVPYGTLDLMVLKTLDTLDRKSVV